MFPIYTLWDADKHGAVVVGVLHQDQQGLGDEVILPQVTITQCQQQTVLPRRLETWDNVHKESTTVNKMSLEVTFTEALKNCNIC